MGMVAVIYKKGAPTSWCGRRPKSDLPSVAKYVFAARLSA